MLNHISKIQSGHSVILASSFGQTRPSVPKPENSHFSDGPLREHSSLRPFFAISYLKELKVCVWVSNVKKMN